MPRLPPAEKLPLAVRKNVRDEWDYNKSDLETQLSYILGEPWTLEATPNAIWPYHNDGYAKESLGSCIKGYMDGAIYQIKYLSDRYSDLPKELNTLCPAHTITLDVEETEPPRFSYNGCEVADGKLRMLFVPTALGSNMDDVCQEGNLFPALNAASLLDGDASKLSFLARHDISYNYDPSIEETRNKIAELTGRQDFKLEPGFEDTFAKLMAESKVKGTGLSADWQGNLGSFTLKYFEGLAYQMNYQKVGDDELIQEGFNEEVVKGEARFRIVDKLKYDSYCEVVIEDGVLYIQSTAATWGSNIDYAASKLIDQL